MSILTADSQYVMKGISEWMTAGSANGWKTCERKPVKNVIYGSALTRQSRNIRLNGNGSGAIQVIRRMNWPTSWPIRRYRLRCLAIVRYQPYPRK